LVDLLELCIIEYHVVLFFEMLSYYLHVETLLLTACYACITHQDQFTGFSEERAVGRNVFVDFLFAQGLANSDLELVLTKVVFPFELRELAG